MSFNEKKINNSEQNNNQEKKARILKRLVKSPWLQRITLSLLLTFFSPSAVQKENVSDEKGVDPTEILKDEVSQSPQDSLSINDSSKNLPKYNESLSDEDFDRLSNDSIPASFPDTDPFPLKK